MAGQIDRSFICLLLLDKDFLLYTRQSLIERRLFDCCSTRSGNAAHRQIQVSKAGHGEKSWL